MQRRLAWMTGLAVVLALGLGLAACSSPASSGGSGGDASKSQSESASAVSASSSGADVDSGVASNSSSADDGSATASSSDGTDSTESPAQSDKAIGVSIQLSSDSILKFDGDAASAQLVEDMEAGRAPVSCAVLYDQMGSLPTVTVTDARTMREVYKRLARMQVSGESSMSVTDSYHMVSFELQDGTKATYNFEGEGILVRGGQSYAVLDRGDLWSYVRHLQDQYLSKESAGADYLEIDLQDDEELVLQCPASAPAGQVVHVVVYDLLDAYPHVSVNGDEDFGKFKAFNEYEFVMPDAPVTVRVWSDTDGLGGA